MQVAVEIQDDRAVPNPSGTARGRDADQIAVIQAGLARLIEGEILPSLARAHPATRQRPPAVASPTPERVAAFARSLAVRDLDEAEVQALADEGLPLATLLLDLLAPAARHLGAMWEEDLCDFIAVTEGLGRLHVLTRRLCAGMETDVPRVGRGILLLPCPGETHLYALSVVASFFREAGWDATILDGARSCAADRVREEWFDAIGISLACDVHLPILAETVTALRRASCNSALAVIVGGPWFARHDADARAVGADACVVDGRNGPRIIEALLASRRWALKTARA